MKTVSLVSVSKDVKWQTCLREVLGIFPLAIHERWFVKRVAFLRLSSGSLFRTLSQHASIGRHMCSTPDAGNQPKKSNQLLTVSRLFNVIRFAQNGAVTGN